MPLTSVAEGLVGSCSAGRWSHASGGGAAWGALGWYIKVPGVSLLWFLFPGTMGCTARLRHVLLTTVFLLDVDQSDRAK